MKKLILLLIVMALGAGVVFAMADPAYPPGVINAGTITAEFSVQQGVDTTATVLVLVTPITVNPSSFQAVMVNDNFIAIQPHSGYLFTDSILSEFRPFYTVFADDYYLRC